jgi:hypothetical protein
LPPLIWPPLLGREGVVLDFMEYAGEVGNSRAKDWYKESLPCPSLVPPLSLPHPYLSLVPCPLLLLVPQLSQDSLLK